MSSLRSWTIAFRSALIAALLLSGCGGDEPAGKQPAETEASGSASQEDLDAAMKKAMEEWPPEQRSNIERGDDGEIRYSGKTADGDAYDAQMGGDVTLPEGFAEQIPIFPDSDAYSVMVVGEATKIVTLDSTATMRAISDFYKEQLPGAGWAIQSDMTLGTGHLLTATQDEQRAVVHIQKMGDGSRIGLSLMPKSADFQEPLLAVPDPDATPQVPAAGSAAE